MITYVTNDLFITPNRIIAHGCNAQGVMGSGVAKQVKEKYPWAFEQYTKQWERYVVYSASTSSMLGKVFTAKEPDGNRIVLNCITQHGYGRNQIRYVSYDAIDKCFGLVRYVLEAEKETELSIPKIGAGLGGGHWPVIAEIINHQLKDFKVNCYTGIDLVAAKER